MGNSGHYARVYRRDIHWEGTWEALEPRTKKPSTKTKKTKNNYETNIWGNIWGWGVLGSRASQVPSQ